DRSPLPRTRHRPPTRPPRAGHTPTSRPGCHGAAHTTDIPTRPPRRCTHHRPARPAARPWTDHRLPASRVSPSPGVSLAGFKHKIYYRFSLLDAFFLVTVAAMRAAAGLLARRGPATLSWLLLAFAIAWVAIKAFGQGFGITGNGPQFVITALNGVSLAALYFIT